MSNRKWSKSKKLIKVRRYRMPPDYQIHGWNYGPWIEEKKVAAEEIHLEDMCGSLPARNGHWLITSPPMTIDEGDTIKLNVVRTVRIKAASKQNEKLITAPLDQLPRAPAADKKSRDNDDNIIITGAPNVLQLANNVPKEETAFKVLKMSRPRPGRPNSGGGGRSRLSSGDLQILKDMVILRQLRGCRGVVQLADYGKCESVVCHHRAQGPKHDKRSQLVSQEAKGLPPDTDNQIIVPLKRPVFWLIRQWTSPSLASMQAMSPTFKLPMDVSLALALGCFRALHAVHASGFVLRRVVPTAFALITIDSHKRRLLADVRFKKEEEEGAGDESSRLMLLARRVVITDVGNARLWPLPPRRLLNFVGSALYSSPRAMRRREQGPSDDLISACYMLTEWLCGKLPWRFIDKDRHWNGIHESKEHFMEQVASNELRILPREVRILFKELSDEQCYSAYSEVPMELIEKKFRRAIQRRLNRRRADAGRLTPPWFPFDL